MITKTEEPRVRHTALINIAKTVSRNCSWVHYGYYEYVVKNLLNSSALPASNFLLVGGGSRLVQIQSAKIGWQANQRLTASVLGSNATIY